MPAALASAASGRQGKFWEYHDKLFDNQKALDAPSLEKYAQELGLNLDKWKKDMADPGLKAEIEAEQALSGKLGARGTPAFFVNGKYMRGAQPFEAFKTRIEEEIKNASAIMAKGVALGKVYEEIIKNGATEAPAAPAGQPPGQRPGQPDPNARYRVDITGAPMKGAKDAKITLAEFSEFQ
jgi:protein-disulfide isomerase